jgi:acetylornithine/succinyldiaminopimelate/putrescine aminotransferase
VTAPPIAAPVDGFAAYGRHVNPVLAAFLRVTGRDLRLMRGKGTTLEDEEGRRYDDWVAGFGSLNLGHNPDGLVRALRQHLERDAPNLYVENLNPAAGRLAARLVEAAGEAFESCVFVNSGAEAVEAAIRVALLATGRRRIAYAAGGYHEPIQVEAGVRIAPDAYLREARALCHAQGALFLLDEVQTGMGRTGRLFAFQHADCPPDVLILAKSLGGGMVPIGAAVLGPGLRERAYGDYLRCEIHQSTMGGNALACEAARHALETVADPGFLASVERTADGLFASLAAAVHGSPVVREIRWRGLLGGLHLEDVRHPWLRFENLGLPELAGRPSSGALLVERLARRGILAQVCGHDWSVLRIEPPLVVDGETCARFVDAVREGVRWLEENA